MGSMQRIMRNNTRIENEFKPNFTNGFEQLNILKEERFGVIETCIKVRITYL